MFSFAKKTFALQIVSYIIEKEKLRVKICSYKKKKKKGITGIQLLQEKKIIKKKTNCCKHTLSSFSKLHQEHSF